MEIIIIIIKNVLIRMTLHTSVVGALYTVNTETLQKLRN